MTDLPAMTQFRVDPRDNGIVHLIFDCPGRTMNVFSEAAIVELGAFAVWLAEADVRGVVIRSGKDNAFCAGADLTELGVAYDMIVAAPPRARFDLAFDHFFRLSKALRALETAGKPVAVAIEGLALGGGCELALAAHHRVLVDDSRIGMGLPESLVGLLPGAGGTQRLPRLVGVEAAMPILLAGARLSGQAAVDAGLVHALARPGEAIASAEAWILEGGEAVQPWDRPGGRRHDAHEVGATLAPLRERVLRETLGHYPAPIAILDCVEFGLPQLFDGAIRSEMTIFAHLIQREEPRNMIQTMFLGKTEYDRLKRKDALPAFIGPIVERARAAIAREDQRALARLGFASGLDISEDCGPDAAPVSTDVLARICAQVTMLGETLSDAKRRLADYATVAEAGFPSYLGGPFALARSRSAQAR